MGEVWLASGQSNMAMQLKECYESTKAILTSQKSNIRFINVPPLGSYKPLTDIKAKSGGGLRVRNRHTDGAVV